MTLNVGAFMRFLFIILLIFSIETMASEGLITIASHYSVDKTTENLIKALEKADISIFTIIDHAKGAESVDMELNPTILVIFGHPKAGTPFMQCEQRTAIDLPLKALIWQDTDGQVWYSYNDLEYIAQRHKTNECAVKTILMLQKVSKKFAIIATE